MRHVFPRKLLPTLVAVAFLAVAPAYSQTLTPTATAKQATPTPTATVSCPTDTTPVSCAGAKKVQLRWSARKPFVIKVFMVATRCEVPPRCAGTTVAGPVSTGPITVTISDATGYRLTTTIDTPVISAGGCPGGVETYRNSSERMRFIYGADGLTTLVGMLRIEHSDGSVPVLTAPLTFDVRDACGYAVDGEVSTCFTKQTATRASLKCF